MVALDKEVYGIVVGCHSLEVDFEEGLDVGSLRDVGSLVPLEELWLVVEG